MSRPTATRFPPTVDLRMPGEASVKPASLVRIYPAEGIGKMIVLGQHHQIIGRESACDIELADDSVSRRHASLDSTEQGFVLTDLGSTNGTYVNDVRIASQQIESGDRIRLGNQIFRFLGTDRVEVEYFESIYKIMTTDGLTQVYNKRYLMEALEREISRCQRTEEPLSVLMFDIDHFKQINDTFGHLAGDEVLRGLCGRAKLLLRKEEVFARYGGEEFTLVMPDTSLEQARDAAERLRQAICRLPFHTNAGDVPVTVSMGVAETLQEQSFAATDLMHRADARLYDAKQAGRNCVRG